MCGQRSRKRDQDRVDLLHGVVVGGRRDSTGVDEGLQRLGGDVADVTLAPVDPVDDLLVHVDEHDVFAGVREDSGKGHPHVAGPHDRNVCTHARTRLLTTSRRYTTQPPGGR